MEITLKIDNLNEINEIKEWFRNKLTDSEWICNQNSYFSTHSHVIAEKSFDEFLRKKIIDLFITTKLVGDDRRVNIPDAFNISGEIYFPGGVYQNIFDVLFEIYKTIDINEKNSENIDDILNDLFTDDCESCDNNESQLIKYTTESTFIMPNIKNNKFMI